MSIQQTMKQRFNLALGIFLLLGGILSSGLGLQLLRQHIPIVSPSYRGWAEPPHYMLSRQDSNTSHRWITLLQLDDVACLIGLLILHRELWRQTSP